MMRFLRKGDCYALEKPKKKRYYLSLNSFQCLSLSLSTIYYQFSCNVQKSRARGTTGEGDERRGRGAKRSSAVVLLTIFCVLFSFASTMEVKAQELRPGGATGFDVVSDTAKRGHRSIPTKYFDSERFAQNNPKFNLKLYPALTYEIDTTIVSKIMLGDFVPESVMNMPLWVVSKNTASDTVTLRELSKGKLLILDFWSTWCRPCVISMNNWEAIQKKYPNDVVLVGVHMDLDYKAYPFIKGRAWESYSVIGMGAALLNWHFFNRRVLSTMAWIRDGRFVAATGTKGYDAELIGRYLQDSSVEIPMKLEVLHSLKVN